ncbi:hypothetical protein Esti_000635 [Eimeria stiedai]
MQIEAPHPICIWLLVFNAAISMSSLQATRLPFSEFDPEWESRAFTSLHGKSRPPHVTSHLSYLTISYAVVLLSLAVAYLLWGCFRSLFGGTVRALAGGEHPDAACTGGRKNVESDEGAAGSEADDRGERDKSAGNKGGPGARRDAAPFQHRRTKSFVRGWAVQQMPLDWMEKIRRSVHKFRDVAVRCALLVDILSPKDSVNLILHTAALASVELGGFAHIPRSMQGVRWSAGRAFVILIQRILKTRSLRMAAIAAGCEGSLEHLRCLIEEVCGLPPLMEGVSPKRFKESVVRHWELNKLTTQHLGHHLDILLSSSTNPGSDLQAQFETVMQVVKALLETRKMHLLGDVVLRRWLGTCHKKILANVLYTREEYEKACRESVAQLSGQLQQITEAVVLAGGSPVVPSFFSNFPSSVHSSTSRGSPLISVQATAGGEAHQRPQQPALSDEYSQAASSVGVQKQLSEGMESPLIASIRLVGIREPTKPTQAGDDYTALGARPRCPAPREMEHAKVVAEAEALGWGPGFMPQQVATQVLLVLDRVERVASACALMFSWLSPEDAVLLSINLARWAATEIASFAFVPSAIQEKKRRAAMRYIALIDSMMNEADTCLAAMHLGVDRDLVLLETLFQELINPLHEPSNLDTRSYMRSVVNAWRLSNYTSRNVNGLVNSLCRTRSVGGVSRGKAKVVSSVIAALCKLRTSQLLADSATGRWFVTCHQKLTPGLFYTDEDCEEARRSGPLSLAKELQKINKVVEQADQPETTAKTLEASPDVGHGSSSHGQKKLNAPATGVPRQQPSGPQPPIRRWPERPKAGEHARESTSTRQTLEATPVLRRRPSPLTQVELNPLAPEFSPQYSSRPQPQIAHTVDHRGAGFWSHPSPPATPVPVIDLPSMYNQPVGRWPDTLFSLVPAEPFEATGGSPVQSPSEVPPSPYLEFLRSSFSTHAHLQPPPPISVGEFHPGTPFLPQPDTSPASWTYPGEPFGAVSGEDVTSVSGRTIWAPRGAEVSDLISRLSSLGTLEEEGQPFGD